MKKSAVEQLRLTTPVGDVISLTCSIGLAEGHPDDDLQRLLRRADTRLYDPKDAGRNRVRA